MNLKLYDTNTTLFITISVLLIMILVCQVSNYLYPKEKFNDNYLYTHPTNKLYSTINYYSLPQGICNNDITNANIPCSTMESSKTKSCNKPLPTEMCKLTKNKLTTEQLTTLYRYLYERSGLEIIKRVINADTIV